MFGRGNGGRYNFGGQVGMAAESEKMILRTIGKVAAVLLPFVLWPIMVGLMIMMHFLWPGMIAVLLTTAAIGCGLAWFAYRYNKSRDLVSRLHGATTILVCTGLMIAASVCGFSSFMLYLYVVGIPALCLTWSMRAFIKHEEGHRNDFTHLFEEAGVGPAKMNLRFPDPSKPVRKLTGKVYLPLGKGGTQQTVDDLTKKVGALEAAGGLPPGSIHVSPDEDNAHYADISLSDPRGLNTNGVWRGPSIPNGGSVSAPLAVGTWQDGEEAEFKIVNNHLQVMGMTGAGKSVGAGWSTMAELMTRKDCAVFAADITKGMQTLGPLRNGLHGVAVTEDDAKDMIIDISQTIKPRLDYLTSRGFHNWQPGCGLTYLVVWLEETPDIIDALGPKGVKDWVKNLKAARSAGISYVLSMQRSDWTQLPTIARGQLGFWCFGVANKKDAQFGLSDAQKAMDVHPERWAKRYPGKSFLDATGVDQTKIGLPLRTWYWGNDASKISAHASQYPSDERPIDTVTLQAMARDNTEGIPDAPDEESIPVVSADQAALNDREKLRKFIVEMGKPAFTITDLKEFVASLGKTRQWPHTVLKDWEKEGFVRLDRESGQKTWHLIDQEMDNLERARRFQTNSKQRALEYGAPVDSTLKAEQLLPLYEQRDCYYCGEPIRGDRQIDHKIPLSRGGAHELSNLVCACKYCNESKGDRTETEFMNSR